MIVSGRVPGYKKNNFLISPRISSFFSSFCSSFFSSALPYRWMVGWIADEFQHTVWVAKCEVCESKMEWRGSWWIIHTMSASYSKSKFPNFSQIPFKKHWHAFSSGMSVEQRHCNYDLKVFHGLGTQPDFFLLTPSESVNHWVIYPTSRFMIVQPWWVLVPHIIHVDFTSFNKPLKKHITSAKWSDYAFESKISSKKHMTNRTCRIRPLLVTLVIFPINFHN